jgi:hypothetical protein
MKLRFVTFYKLINKINNKVRNEVLSEDTSFTVKRRAA